MQPETICALFRRRILAALLIAGGSDSPAVAARLYNAESAAIGARDYDAFISHGTDAFKKAITKDVFNKAYVKKTNNALAGATARYDGQKSLSAATIYVWYVTCKNGSRYLAVLGVQNGKVATFFYDRAPASME